MSILNFKKNHFDKICIAIILIFAFTYKINESFNPRPLIIKQETNIFNSKKYNKKKLTFIFDFDDTMYDAKPSGSYVDMFYTNIFKRTKYSKEEVFKFIHDNHLSPKTPKETTILLEKLLEKFNIDFKQEDIDYTINQLNKVQTAELGNIVKNLIKNGHHVMIVGGGSFGCAIIPKFVEQFGIKKENIYSGYYKDFSKESLSKLYYYNDNWQYVNCANPDNNTVYSHNKSELIKFLKEQNKINKNSKIIHIGDGKNDLEVWKGKQCDLFIGFGVNYIDKVVEKESPIYIKDINGLINFL